MLPVPPVWFTSYPSSHKECAGFTQSGETVVLAGHFRRGALAAGIAGTCLLAACGGSSSNGEAKKTGSEVAKDASAALRASHAVHLTGQLTDSASKMPITVDVQLQDDGTKGTFTFGGQTVQVIAVGSTTYLKTTAAFYEGQGSSAATAAKLANKWVKDPDASEFNDFTLSGLSKQLSQPSSKSKINDAVTTGKLDGKKVVIVSETDGSKLYVAATGKPLPLQLSNSTSSADGSGAVRFSNYGKHQDVQAPPGPLDVFGAGS